MIGRSQMGERLPDITPSGMSYVVRCITEGKTNTYAIQKAFYFNQIFPATLLVIRGLTIMYLSIL